MKALRRAHEWAADHFWFVQYPRLRRVRAPSKPENWLGWLILAVCLAAIWSGPLFWLLATLVVISR